MKGGTISKTDLLSRIVSIGYELESGQISPLAYAPNPASPGEIIRASRIDEMLAPKPNDMIRSHDSLSAELKTMLLAYDEYMTENALSPSGQVYAGADTSPFDMEQYRVDHKDGEEVPDYQTLDHTEFKITYRTITSSDNIMLEYLHKSLLRVKAYYSDYSLTRIRPYTKKGSIRTYANIEVPEPKEGPKNAYVHLARHSTDPRKGYLVMSSSKEQRTISKHVQWVPQCTLGVRLADVPDVMEYISKGTAYESVTRDIKRKSSVLSHKHYADSPHLRDIRAFCYLTMMYTHEVKYNHNKSTFKYAVRHPYEDLYDDIEARLTVGFTQDLRDYVIANIRIPRDSESTWPEYLGYDEVQQYPYEDNIVLIEIRNFGSQLRKLIGVKFLSLDVMISKIEELL